MSTPTRSQFDAGPLKAYMKQLLPSILHSKAWPPASDRDRTKEWIKEIGERVKLKMLEIQPTGFKFIVFAQVNENLGQGGRADLTCHWEDSDSVAQEIYSNDSLICICIAFAIRII